MQIITAAEIVARYVRSLEVRARLDDYSQGALERVSRKLKSFTAEYGAVPVHELRQWHFAEWWTGHFDVWLSDYTRRDARDAVLGCFRWAVDQELIDRCPFHSPKFRLTIRPRQPMRWSDYCLLMWEATACTARRQERVDLPACRRRRRKGSHTLRLALFFMAYTGARPGEMREAEWSDYDEHAGVIRLFKHKTARVTGKCRLIGLPAKVRRILSVMRRRQPSGAIFRNAEGHPWSKDVFCRHFRRHADKAGIDPKLTSYCLRHGFAVQAIEAGVGERQLADQLGHETTRMTSHYARASRTNGAHLCAVAEAATKRNRGGGN